MGRRMNEMAVNLTENVFPKVPIRQFVLSIPKQLRYMLAYNPKLTTIVLNLFLKTVSKWYKKRAKKKNITNCQTGAITFVQRFGSSLNVNVHFHTLFLDGVYVIPKNRDSPPWFQKINYPTDEEIKELSEDISKTIITKLKKQGYLEKFKVHDPLMDSLPLSQITGASIQHMIAFGQNSQRPVRRILQDPHEGQRSSDLCYSSSGFSLHADRDRGGVPTLIVGHSPPPQIRTCGTTASGSFGYEFTCDGGRSVRLQQEVVEISSGCY